MSGRLSRDGDQMLPVAGVGTAANARMAIAKEFVLRELQSSRRSLSLGDLAQRGIREPDRLTSEETRGAIATLVDHGEIELTDDLHVRLARRKRS